jgi:hypothetical protein
MDFHVPKTLLPALKRHLAADWLQDDDYSLVLAAMDDWIDQVLLDYPQVQCITDVLEKERISGNRSRCLVKGYSFYYQTPTFASRYAEDGVVTISTGFPGDRGTFDSANSFHRIKLPQQHLKRSKLQPSHLTLSGFAAQFDNRSPEPLLLFWDCARSNRATLIGEIAPLERLGTATIPGQASFLTPVHDRSHKVVRWVVTAETAVYVYDPSSTHTLEQRDEQQVGAQWKNTEQEHLYNMLRLHDEFARHYLIHSKRHWLATFPRALPIHHSWSAKFFLANAQRRFTRHGFFRNQQQQQQLQDPSKRPTHPQGRVSHTPGF